MPCFKINHRLKCTEATATVQALRLSGWFYRVLEEGTLSKNEPLQLVARPYPDLTVSRGTVAGAAACYVRTC